MTQKSIDQHLSAYNPIELIEDVMTAQELPFHRLSDVELATEVEGRWGSYHLQFFWQEDIKALHFSSIMDLKINDVPQPNLFELLSLLNERMILGHFEIYAEEDAPAFRYSFLVPTPQTLPLDLIEDAIEICLDECERCYPAFQYLISGEKGAKEAAAIAIMDTAGEA
jgi:hypothetical protein